MSKKIKAALVGSKGRFGSSIIDMQRNEFFDSVEFSVLVDRENGEDLKKSLNFIDIILDVSAPENTEKIIKNLIQSKKIIPYVIGCTGWNEDQLKIVHAYSQKAVVLLSPNFSPAIALFLKLLKKAAPFFLKWRYDAIIHETHHMHKKDSPSGTTKAIVEKLGDLKPQVHSSRAGNIIGTHEVRFIGPGDTLSFTHAALDRSIFARGALMAALWLYHKKTPGFYTMQDVLQ